MTVHEKYTIHERIWHWVQALTIVALMITGAEIHAPHRIHLLGFSTAVFVHNSFAALLLLNALLGLFYFFTSGLLKIFGPDSGNFMGLALEQTRYYMFGIFRGDTHPMERHTEQKLNPLQQITYIGILNVLLPMQILSGILIWGAQRWPEFTAQLGGLQVLVPIHLLTAWFFLAETIAHIYMTTTGPTVTAHVRAMITGREPAGGQR
jgi:thiosulfate reductase cytochrome b subunit